jgi:hypothetical protein
MLIAIVMVISGITLFVWSLVFELQESVVTVDMGDLTDEIAVFRALVFTTCVTSAVIIVILGTFGTLWSKNLCNNISMNIIDTMALGCVWMVLIAMGSVMMSMASQSNYHLD